MLLCFIIHDLCSLCEAACDDWLRDLLWPDQYVKQCSYMECLFLSSGRRAGLHTQLEGCCISHVLFLLQAPQFQAKVPKLWPCSLIHLLHQ